MPPTLLAAAAASAGPSSSGLLLLAALGVIAFAVGHLTRGWLSEVIAFMAVGVVVGPEVLDLVGKQDLAALEPVVSVALGAIVFGLASRLEMPQLRRIRRTVTPLAVADIGLTFVTVLGLAVLAGADSTVAYLVAAIAVSTSPSTMMAVIGEVRARGSMTDHALAVAALNNAASALLFGLGLPVVLAIEGGASVGLLAFARLALVSGLVGALAGIVLRRTYGAVHSVGERLLLVSLALLSMVALCFQFDAPVVVATLVAGAVFANDRRDTDPLFDSLRTLDAPIFLVFFVVAGAGLHLQELMTMGALGVAATVGRGIGKLAGGYLGASVDPRLRDRGWGLASGLAQLPFAGMAIGLAAFTLDATAAAGTPELGAQVSAVVFGSVVVFELLGPAAVKRGLQRTGDAGRDDGSAKVVVDRTAPHTIRRMLFPVSNPQMALSKAAVVADLAASSGASLHVLHVLPEGATPDPEEMARRFAVLQIACDVRDVEVTMSEAAGPSLLEVITEQAHDLAVDLVLVGEPTGRLSHRHRMWHEVTRRLAPAIHVLVVPTVDGVGAQDPAVPQTFSTRADGHVDDLDDDPVGAGGDDGGAAPDEAGPEDPDELAA